MLNSRARDASRTSSALTCSSRCTSTDMPTPTAEASRPTTTVRPAESPRQWGSASPHWCSARSWHAPGLRDCRTHAKTWDLLRLTWMPAVRVDLGYLTSPADRARLVDPRSATGSSKPSWPPFSGCTCPLEADVATGSIDVRQLASADREPQPGLIDPRLADAAATVPSAPSRADRVAGRTGRSSPSGLIDPSSFSSAYSTSDFQDSAVRSSRRSRG